MSGSTFPATITVTQVLLAPVVEIAPGAAAAPSYGAALGTIAAPAVIATEDGAPILLESGGGAILMEAL